MRSFLLFLTMFLFGVTASARTWHVRVDGTGDAPSIEAAVDSCAVGDTILVAPGNYALLDTADLPNHCVLVSEAGPAETSIEPGNLDTTFGMFLNSYTTLDGFTVHVFSNIAVVATNSKIQNCIFTWGARVELNGINGLRNSLFLPLSTLMGTGGVTATYNIFLGQITCTGGGFACNVVSSDLSPCIPHDINFFLDPLFCDETGGNYFLRPDSPCLPENGPLSFCEERIGPLPVGCAPVPAEAKSWGQIKVRYR